MNKHIKIYDTTLRDGTQGEGVSFSKVDKVRIAERLDELGVAYIEGGWPGSNPKDMGFFDEAKGVNVFYFDFGSEFFTALFAPADIAIAALRALFKVAITDIDVT